MDKKNEMKNYKKKEKKINSFPSKGLKWNLCDWNRIWFKQMYKKKKSIVGFEKKIFSNDIINFCIKIIH